MKKYRGVLILCVSLLTLSLSAYPVLAAQQEQGTSGSRTQQPSATSSDMQGSTQNGMQQQGMHKDMQQQGMQQTSAQRGTPIYVGPASVLRIQQKLNQQENMNLKTDGIWGRSTADAIKRFQQSNSLAPTGNLNIETVQALGAPEVLSGAQMQQGAQQNQQFAKTHGARLYIGPATLRQIQNTLHQEGYTIGQADGMWGPKTQQAIRKFQQDKGLAPTGNIDLAMINQLGLGQIIAALSTSGSANMAMGQQEQMGQTGQPEARGYYGQNQKAAQPGAKGKMQSQKQAMGQGAPLYAGPQTIRQVQQSLSDAGHNPGQANGQWDQSTQKALKSYQKSQNLAPTGTLTVDTVDKLMGGFNLQQGTGSQSSGSQQSQ